MERKYRDATALEIGVCQKVTDDSLILKQIAYNLAHIADELAESNRLNARTIGEIVEDLEMNGIKPEPEKEDAATGLRAELSEGADVFDGDCFICGKPVDDTNVGGIIIDGDGDSYRACAKCKNRFSKMVATIMMPNSIYF